MESNKLQIEINRLLKKKKLQKERKCQRIVINGCLRLRKIISASNDFANIRQQQQQQ